MLFIDKIKSQFPKLKNIFEIGAHRGSDIFVIIKAWLEQNGFQEVDRVHQLKISGDSLFLNTRFLKN